MPSYEIKINADLAGISPTYKRIMDDVNDFMHSCGFHETAAVRSDIMTIEMTTSEPLTNEQMLEVEAMAQDGYREKFPDAHIAVTVMELVG